MFRISPYALFLVVATFALAQSPAELIEKQHFKQARALLEKKLATNSKDAAALAGMAEVKLAYRDVDGAMKLAEEAVAADGSNVFAHQMLFETCGTKAGSDDAGMFEKMRLA